MAISSTFTVNGITVTRIDSHDQLPLAAGTSVLRKSNAFGCGCAIPGDSPVPQATVNTVADANRFPTATLSAGVYKS